jgi:hypothetical protein
MKRNPITIMAIFLALSGLTATGQDRVARSPVGTLRAATDNPSQAQAAIQQAAAANKFVFIFFWRGQNQQTDKAWTALKGAMDKITDQAEVVSVQITNPAEKAIVDRYGVSRSPMPLVMAVAPCGAITKAFTGAIDENKLHAALVSPCTQQCLKALQDRKLVLVCVTDQADQQDSFVPPQGVRDFKADKKYGGVTEIIKLNPRDQNETTFLKELQVQPISQKTVTVLLAPPGSVIGKFDAAATKQQIIAKLAATQSGCCPGGKCGPNGCCPKK